MKKKVTQNENQKVADLAADIEDGAGEHLTTNQGLRINDDQNSLKSGERGPTLLEDFHFREKVTHFDHERIPERIVHARGAAAHGIFELYESMSAYTKAAFLQKAGAKTPVFVRFSTVAGSRGSTDLARDVRGFAVKFYTEEGNYDLVGNNMPVFFIQDAVKFPDLIHAVKPEPHNEIPQAASAHDTFWDFISLMPESAHMVMWLMSDRAIPRSYRMMEGFGVHTFRLVNEQGQGTFVKFHWKPLLGMHSVVWDEAKKISGNDPDFHRRDLWEAIEAGAYPEWELGVQLIPEEDEHKFNFDLLDPTKLVPEELVPVLRIGKMTLNRNPDNFFAETEQVAFHPGHIVSGIDFSNDPLLQGRLFSYTDTQLIRLGGPNFHEIPVNRPIAPLHNNQRDGYMRQQINRSRTSYEPNSIGGGCPMQARERMGGFVSYAEKIEGKKIRARSESFFDHFSQAALFYNSQSDVEKSHIVKAFCFELGKVEIAAIRERMVGVLEQVDSSLAERVARGLGLKLPIKSQGRLNHSVPADGDPTLYQPTVPDLSMAVSPALSILNSPNNPEPSIKSRKIAILAADGVDGDAMAEMCNALTEAGAMCKVVAPRHCVLTDQSGKEINIDFSFLTSASVLFDAVYVPGGQKSVETLLTEADALHFINECYKHCKAIGASAEGVQLLNASSLGAMPAASTLMDHSAEWVALGVVVTRETQVTGMINAFMEAIAKHRHWSRERADLVPA